MREFCMPSLGADMEVGTVVEWHVGPGDRVKRGDVVALVETEKGLIEVEIWEDGVIDSIAVPIGQKVPVGAVLALLRPNDQTTQPAFRPAEKPAPSPALPPVESPPRPVEPSAGVRRRVSPLARRRAEERGVDLATLSGSGEGGAITMGDVDRAIGASGRVPPSTAAEPVPAVDRQAAMRHAIAMAMARSKREIPHYYLGTHIDVSSALAWLAEENAKRPVNERLLYSVLLIKAVALAAREVPEMNGFWVDGAFKPGGGVHVGWAISLRQGGLIAPAIHDADQKDVNHLMRDMLDVVKRARAGVLRSSEIADATITATSLGDQGVETVFGVIYPPQVALVGFGKVREQPWATNGMLGVRPVITASVAADHRASDGHRGGRFLAAIERLLQEPEKL